MYIVFMSLQGVTFFLNSVFTHILDLSYRFFKVLSFFKIRNIDQVGHHLILAITMSIIQRNNDGQVPSTSV